MIDPRSNSEEKLVPPNPLPYVSRKALKRVKNPLPAPVSCPYCSGPVDLVENSVIYKGHTYGDWPYAYDCRPCDAYVGLHPDTDVPLGTLANKALREARKKAKNEFHEWMELDRRNRNSAYQWLSEKMNLTVGECHFGWFNEDQCEEARDHCHVASARIVNF
jgi:hypothetical protein